MVLKKYDVFVIPDRAFVGSIFTGKMEVIGLRKYKLSDIVGYNVIENGQTITKGSLGRAVAGGILFGGVGAVVGAVTGERKETKNISELRVDIEMNHHGRFTLPINILSKGLTISNTDQVYEIYTGIIGQIQNALNSIIEQNYNKSKENKNGNPIVDKFDEVKKYKELLDQGIISKEEYEKKRKELLGL